MPRISVFRVERMFDFIVVDPAFEGEPGRAAENFLKWCSVGAHPGPNAG